MHFPHIQDYKNIKTESKKIKVDMFCSCILLCHFASVYYHSGSNSLSEVKVLIFTLTLMSLITILH